LITLMSGPKSKNHTRTRTRSRRSEIQDLKRGMKRRDAGDTERVAFHFIGFGNKDVALMSALSPAWKSWIPTLTL
jgi:hypothetical protein